MKALVRPAALRMMMVSGWIIGAIGLGACGGSEEADPRGPRAEKGRAGGHASDGELIAFSRGEGEGKTDYLYPDIWVMQADGTEQAPLTDSPRAVDSRPAFSPDGQRIAFTRVRDGTGADVYVMNVDGTDETKLTSSPDAGGGGPAWSPDGQQIAFSSGRDDPGERPEPFADIYLMDADGTDVTRVAARPDSDDGAPAWSPDGERIAFTGLRDPADGSGAMSSDIYVMQADGSEQTNLTDGPEFDDISFRTARRSRRTAGGLHSWGFS